MKYIKQLSIVFLCVLGFLVLSVLGYFIYLQVTYYRVGDQKLEIDNKTTTKVETGKELKALTYNIGFGAYDRDFSFFLDEGILKDGGKTKGKYGRAFSEQHVLKNTEGAIKLTESLNPDFIMLEEVDLKGTRSYNVNQVKMFQDSFKNYDNTFALNFHSSFLLVPFGDMHGRNLSGLLTLSRYQMESSQRIELPIETNMISKLFDYDRALDLVRYPIEGSNSELVMITSHFSAYDKGGVSKKRQMALLKEIMTSERQKGNYVIVGGDFNNDIANTLGKFETNQEKPLWLGNLNEDELPKGFRLIADDKNPSCRGADEPWQPGISFQTTVDGFIVSDNIEVKSVTNIVSKDLKDISFMYSDHNPSLMEFILKS